MIEGVEILSKTAVMEMIEPKWGIMFICVLLVFATIITAEFLNDKKKKKTAYILAGFAAIGIVISIARIGRVETWRYQYEVIINESISLDEIYEKYNVIEQQGKMFILEDKEKE